MEKSSKPNTDKAATPRPKPFLRYHKGVPYTHTETAPQMHYNIQMVFNAVTSLLGQKLNRTQIEFIRRAWGHYGGNPTLPQINDLVEGLVPRLRGMT